MPTTFYRDHVIQWSKDLGRAIDFLETRKEIQRDKVAYCGLSWGARLGGLLPAVENRLKANVLVGAGLRPQATLSEVDQINFTPRVTIPTLMLNGRYDYIFPQETSQLPMFRLLGTPHSMFQGQAEFREAVGAGQAGPLGSALHANFWLHAGNRYLSNLDDQH